MTSEQTHDLDRRNRAASAFNAAAAFSVTQNEMVVLIFFSLLIGGRIVEFWMLSTLYTEITETILYRHFFSAFGA